MKRYEAYKPVTSRWAKQLPFYWEFQKIAEVFIERNVLQCVSRIIRQSKVNLLAS